ncbi:hypothetical protein LP417_26870 [Polaromonas sp. P1-6]|nr:hypothetical protein LP417_26870 [Polaromonas sp. P1-6]
MAEYKLAVNSSKTIDHIRPFITGPSISRHKISADITDFFNKHREMEVVTDDQGVAVSRRIKIRAGTSVSAVTNQTIASLKRSIGENGSYDACANYFFGTVKKLLSRLQDKPLVAEKGDLGNQLYFFSALVDIVFFYYSMTPRVRQTYVTSEIVLMIIKIMDAAPTDLKDSLIRKIVHESRLIIVQGSVERTAYKVEVMNLLIVLRGLGEKYLLDQESIFHVFGLELRDDGTFGFGKNFDYFQVVFLLFT